MTKLQAALSYDFDELHSIECPLPVFDCPLPIIEVCELEADEEYHLDPLDDWDLII